MVQLMECLHEWIQELDDKDNTMSEFCLCCGIDHNQYRKIRDKIMGEIDRIGNKTMIERSNQILNSESIGIHTPISKQKEIEYYSRIHNDGTIWTKAKHEDWKTIKNLQKRGY